MEVCKLTGQLKKKVLSEIKGDCALGLFQERKLVGFVGWFNATPTEPDLFLTGIAINKEFRSGSLKLLGALRSVILAQKARIEGFHVLCDSQSTQGERLAKIATRKLDCPVIDLGKIDRIIGKNTVQESGAWQGLV